VLAHARRMWWWVLLALASIALAHGNLALSGGIFVLGVIVCYLVSLQRHPNRTCRACGGSGRHQGIMFPWAHRPCGTCGGTPRHRRWGVQLLHGAPGERVRAEKAAKDAGARRGAPR